jgi:hypothetical protein
MKNVKELNVVIEIMDNKIKELTELVTNLLSSKISELEAREKDSEAKIDILIKQVRQNVDNPKGKGKVECFRCKEYEQQFNDKKHIEDSFSEEA